MSRKLILAVLLVLVPFSLQAEEPVDLSMMTRIRDEGFHRSQVMDTLFHLTEVIGPRLTGSPQLKEANEWTRGRFESWGLANARLEGYPFGRGWSFTACQVRMVSPRQVPLLALPKAWTPGTGGAARGEVMEVEIATEKDFEQYRGKIAGKILLLDDLQKIEEPEEPQLQRYSREQLDELLAIEISEEAPRFQARAMAQWRMRRALKELMEKEKVLATLEASSRPNGVLRVTGGGNWEPGQSVGVPTLVLAVEHYNEIVRLVRAGRKVELEVDVAARYHDDDLEAYNTVAEIPGTDKKAELVMAGAHLDSWHTGTGATDNAAGSAVVMGAARILKALGVKPRRTIRFALWSGEEQGYFGSLTHVKQHFATRPESDDPKQKELPEWLREDGWPLTLKPGHARLSVYFNVDGGAGKIRGVYAEENAAVKPIFEAWLAPFADLGASTVTLRGTGGTDHVVFDRVGLPGFQFIQDELDYRARTHHTNLDTYDHVKREDLIQASVILAAFLYDAAMRPELLPRKPLPQKPQEPPKKQPQEKEVAP